MLANLMFGDFTMGTISQRAKIVLNLRINRSCFVKCECHNTNHYGDNDNLSCNGSDCFVKSSPGISSLTINILYLTSTTKCKEEKRQFQRTVKSKQKQ